MTDAPLADARARRWRRAAVAIADLGVALALVAGVALLLAGAGHRFGWWSFGTGFQVLRWATLGGIAAAVISAAGLIIAPLRAQRRGMFRALVGLIVGLVVAGVPLGYLQTARALPPIHDITTDPEDPPEFEAIGRMRADAPNPVAYGGPEVAAQQRAAYPDIVPADVPVAPEVAFEAALVAADAMGWTVVATDKAVGRIEATDRTFWFGFIDDVVVRVRPTDAGSRIDVRSTSRVGRGDFGTNAARIREYLQEVKAQLNGTR